ncbi:type IV pilin protein [Terriglobus tenax]|uniref:type IV pilin protein n=1 Tax=Terriglobus tenax TaxID=1111115 RepID=UPI0021E0F33A|nr:prepilin-type N-terminal cleavage/methylation domain-containing protein [Terriglobus tenax]
MNTKSMSGRLKRSNERGFSLVELLIVMSVILILMTLAIPQLTKIRRKANETSAIQSVRAIAQAEQMYQSNYPANGFACSLSALGGEDASGAASPTSAHLLPSDLSAGVKAGYTFAITNCTKVTVNNTDQYTSYEITAVPQQVGKTGDRGFCSDESQQVKYDPAGGTACTAPVQ